MSYDHLSVTATHLRSISVREVLVPRALMTIGVSIFILESARDSDSIDYKQTKFITKTIHYWTKRALTICTIVKRKAVETFLAPTKVSGLFFHEYSLSYD